MENYILPEMTFENIDDYIYFLEVMEIAGSAAKKAGVTDEELNEFASLIAKLKEDENNE